ncbi:MAG: hypothetical protein ABIH23_07425 [bacterium]
MLVAGRQIHSDGKVYERGQVVKEAASWPPYVKRAHLSCGSLLDLTKEQLTKLQSETKTAKQLADRQRAVKSQGRLEKRHAAVVSDIELLMRQLEKLHAQLEEIEEEMTATPRDTDENREGSESQVRPRGDSDPGGGAAVTTSPPPVTGDTDSPSKTIDSPDMVSTGRE